MRRVHVSIGYRGTNGRGPTGSPGSATDAAKQTVILATVVQTVGVPLRALAVAADAAKQTVLLATVVQTVGVSLGSAVLLDYRKKR